METYFGLKQDTLQKCVSIVRSAVKQYRVSILLILSLKFLFPSHSVTKGRFCSWCRATVSSVQG